MRAYPVFFGSDNATLTGRPRQIIALAAADPTEVQSFPSATLGLSPPNSPAAVISSGGSG
jgi:hypothetical protein